MAPNNTQRRSSRLTMAIVIATTLVGLVLVTVGRGTEQKVLFADSTAKVQQTATADTTHATGTAYQPMTSKNDAIMSLVKMLAALAVVVVCIYVAVFFLKKLMNRRYTGSRGTSLLEVIETAHIDPKKSLSLVRVADKAVLIGVTDNQITVLTELDPQHTQSVVEHSARKQQDDSFLSMLKSASDKFKGNRKSDSSSES